MRLKYILGSAIALGAMVQAQAAMAQDAPDSADAAQTPATAAPEPAAASSNEIIVTARKRAETLQNVPVVAQAFQQESLEQYGTDSIAALTTRVPDLQAGTGVNATGTQISLRGVGTTALNATIDQSVSLNIDGLPLTQGLAYSIALFDLGQLEVLKGPQSLFYGKNSPGGVISMRSADPTDEFELVARAGYEFEGEEKVGELIVSGPITDSLGFRLAGRYSSMNGYFKNVAEVLPDLGTLPPLSDRFPNADTIILRGTLMFEPSASYSARLKVNYGRYEEQGSATALDVGYCPDGTGGVPPTGLPFIGGDNCKIDGKFRVPTPDPDAFAIARNNAVPFFLAEQWFGTLEQTLALGDDASLTSVTTYYNIDSSTIHLASSTGTVAVILQDNDFSNEQFTQELRIETDMTNSPFNMMIGAFYQDAQLMNHVRVPANTELIDQGYIALPPLLMSPRHYVDIESFSAFGQGMLDITDTLEFTAGARWTVEERRHREFNHYNPDAPFEVPLLVPKLDSSNISPEFTLAYRPTSDLTIFGSYKWGFKSGSFNSATYINSTTNASFNDEKVQGAELGVKSQLMDGALTLNLAGYRYIYDDLQVGALELQQLPGGTPTYALRTINAAGAKVQGIELETSLRPHGMPGLNLYAAVNYNHARYTDFPNAPCGNGQPANAGCDQLLNPSTGRYTAQDLSGRRLVRAPDWSLSAGADYETPIGSALTLVLGGNMSYNSEYSTTLVDMPGFEQDGFAKFNANIALRGPDDRWEFALIGKNLSDEYTTSLCFNTNLQNATVLGGQISGGDVGGPAGRDEAACAVDRGRSVLARLTFRM
ncbi:TonB-dependent receptor [Croceicoccus sp. Ery5]|uniref:TonB-dependent receptor n=1 Tax=Croceicoccus sp. Ery5 TaxID=1703340 RepID=UPI001E36D7BF|nr:TonB-dependent receptor [Croceicoccus sp. Ery5]